MGNRFFPQPGQPALKCAAMPMTFKDRKGQPLSLVLYMYESCPFCQRVLQAIEDLGMEVPLRDVRKDWQAMQDLITVGKSRQVPCLVKNGQALYESADIVAFLTHQVVGTWDKPKARP